jgi:radical SAM superfamily enzyme YgiQ (UPF0313 family)
MNIKIIEPRHLIKKYDIGSLTPNLGPVVIGTLLKLKGHNVEVISEYITKLNLNEIRDSDLVGISITTYNARRGFEVARDIKKPVVFGGFHASLNPEECLQYGDYVIRGDGHSVVALVDFLNNRGIKNIRQIPNLVYKENNQVLFNQTETKAINIVPDFSLVRDYYKFSLNRLLRIPLLVNASRGCPYNCSFCSVKAVYPDLRKKGRKTIVNDIKSQIKNQHVLSRFLPKIIWITDDNFFADKIWARDVLIELAKLKTSYKFVIQARPEIAYDDEILALVKKAGIGIIYMGLESLNPNSLANLKKDSTLDDIKYAVKKIKNYGLNIHGLFVFGDDNFRKGDGLKVADFVKQHNLSGVLIQPLTPFPGTKLFHVLKEENRILHEDWQFYNGKVVFRPKGLKAAELQKEVYDCYRSVYGPSRIIKFILFGPRGFKLAGLGEAIFRHLEWLKTRKYIKEKLSVISQ